MRFPGTSSADEHGVAGPVRKVAVMEGAHQGPVTGAASKSNSARRVITGSSPSAAIGPRPMADAALIWQRTRQPPRCPSAAGQHPGSAPAGPRRRVGYDILGPRTRAMATTAARCATPEAPRAASSCSTYGDPAAAAAGGSARRRHRGLRGCPRRAADLRGPAAAGSPDAADSIPTVLFRGPAFAADPEWATPARARTPRWSSAQRPPGGPSNDAAPKDPAPETAAEGTGIATIRTSGGGARRTRGRETPRPRARAAPAAAGRSLRCGR
jgi:hypothetical protein